MSNLLKSLRDLGFSVIYTEDAEYDYDRREWIKRSPTCIFPNSDWKLKIYTETQFVFEPQLRSDWSNYSDLIVREVPNQSCKVIDMSTKSYEYIMGYLIHVNGLIAGRTIDQISTEFKDARIRDAFNSLGYSNDGWKFTSITGDIVKVTCNRRNLYKLGVQIGEQTHQVSVRTLEVDLAKLIPTQS